jgi:hypothetical protein
MELSYSERLRRAIWELDNNPRWICMIDPEMGNLQIEIDVLILIAPEEYSSPLENARRRKLAISQGVFTPAPKTN